MIRKLKWIFSFTIFLVTFGASLITVYQFAYDEGTTDQIERFRKQLSAENESIPAQEINGVAVKFTECRHEDTRLSCLGILTALDKDVSIQINKYTEAFDNHGNSAHILSLIMPNGKSIVYQHYCTAEIPLIKGVPTKIQFVFDSPSSSYIKVSALKFRVGDSCVGNKKLRTFYNLPV